jgi:hypothetical protein
LQERQAQQVQQVLPRLRERQVQQQVPQRLREQQQVREQRQELLPLFYRKQPEQQQR